MLVRGGIPANRMHSTRVPPAAAVHANTPLSPSSKECLNSAALRLTRLDKLMAITEGRPEVLIGLIDGPVAVEHPDLRESRIRILNPNSGVIGPGSAFLLHGTFVAGMLVARRSLAAPAVCPECSLLVRPVFGSGSGRRSDAMATTSDELAQAIIEVVSQGARVINLSVALLASFVRTERALRAALDFAFRRNVILVAAAGNQGAVGASPLIQHPAVIPVVACGGDGRPLSLSNLGRSIGIRGVSAPGDRIRSLQAGSPEPLSSSGTSVAAPFVTGAIALLWSEYPGATASDIRLALVRPGGRRSAALVPRLLDAWGAHEQLRSLSVGRTHGGFVEQLDRRRAGQAVPGSVAGIHRQRGSGHGRPDQAG